MGKMKNPDVRSRGMCPGLYQDLGIVLILRLLSVACLLRLGVSFWLFLFGSLILSLCFRVFGFGSLVLGL